MVCVRGGRRELVFHIKAGMRSEDQEDGEQYNHTGYQYTFPVPVLIS